MYDFFLKIVNHVSTALSTANNIVIRLNEDQRLQCHYIEEDELTY